MFVGLNALKNSIDQYKNSQHPQICQHTLNTLLLMFKDLEGFLRIRTQTTGLCYYSTTSNVNTDQAAQQGLHSCNSSQILVVSVSVSPAGNTKEHKQGACSVIHPISSGQIGFRLQYLNVIQELLLPASYV